MKCARVRVEVRGEEKTLCGGAEEGKNFVARGEDRTVPKSEDADDMDRRRCG